MRMIALAQAWRRRGGEADFLCCLCPDGLRIRVENAGFSVQMIEADPGSHVDLNALLEAVRDRDGACVALDNYHFNFQYQSEVRRAAKRSLVVDDYGHLDWYCADVVLNQNPSAPDLDLPSRSPNSIILEGTRFALIREEFLKIQRFERPESEGLNLMITMGGGDPDNVTGLVLNAVARCGGRIDEAQVIVGGANPNLDIIRKQASALPFPAEVFLNVADMPQQMCRADVAITAGGSTCWELAFMGVPMAVILVAENQRRSIEAFARDGAAVVLGSHSDLSPESIRRSIENFISDARTRQLISNAARRVVDGAGSDRVAAALAEGIKYG